MTGPVAANLGARLVGAWRLRSWASIGDDGSIAHPMGEDPEGILVYTGDGTMITTMGRAGRTPIAGDDPLGGPVEDRLAALESFVAYSGTFELDGNDVLHRVSMSLFPNWVGSVQRRHVELTDGDRVLILRADPFVLRGRLARQEVHWERIG